MIPKHTHYSVTGLLIYCKKGNLNRLSYPSSIANRTTPFVRGSIEVIPPYLLHRVKQGTTLSLNIQVRPPGKTLPLPVNRSKEALSC